MCENFTYAQSSSRLVDAKKRLQRFKPTDYKGSGILLSLKNLDGTVIMDDTMLNGEFLTEEFKALLLDILTQTIQYRIESVGFELNSLKRSVEEGQK